jgi:plastocyanin
MMFNLASIFTAVVLALPMTALAAPAVASSDSALKDRSNSGHHKTYKVTVGAYGKLRYDPEYVDANVGDYVKFEL